MGRKKVIRRDTLPVSALSADRLAAIQAIAHAGDESAWGLPGQVDAVMQEHGCGKLVACAVVGAAGGVSGHTVRQHYDLRATIGQDVLDEFPQFGVDFWRVLVPIARRKASDAKDADAVRAVVVELAGLYAATSDDYAGLPIPPDVLKARLRETPDGTPARGTPLERARERLAKAAGAVDKALYAVIAATGEPARDTWDALYPQIVKWCEQETK